MIEGWGLAAAAVVAGGAVASAEISSSASKSAAQSAANAAQQGANAQERMFNTTQANYAPQILLGQNASTMLEHLTGAIGGKPDYSGFNNSPGYKFSLDQGTQAINKQAAASGGLYSSNTLAAQNNYAQGQASTQYNSYINQLLTMAGLGNAASSGTGTAATATGQGLANSYQNAGNAQASGVLGQSNAFTNALGQGSNLLGNYMNSQGNSGYSPGYQTNGGYVYNGVEQNGGMGGGIGNIVGSVD